MATAVPADVVKVAESGSATPRCPAVGRHGYDAILVGESFVTATDPAAAFAGLPRRLMASTTSIWGWMTRILGCR